MSTDNNKTIKRIFAMFLALSLLSFQYGCAQLPYRLPPPMSEAHRSRLGTIGVVAADFAPKAVLLTQSRGKVKGAAKSIADEIEGGTFFPIPLGSPAIGIPGAAVALGAIAVGVLIYAATSKPAEATTTADSHLKEILLQLKIQESLRKRFFETSKEQTRFDFIIIEHGGPKNPSEILKYDHLKEIGIDTVIELSVLSIGFEGAGGKDPLLSLLINARTRVLNVSSGEVIYENKLEYRSAKRRFTEWISGDGKLFCDGLETGYSMLSDKIVEELFLLYDFNRRTNS